MSNSSRFNTPYIIKESSRGFDQISILDEMFSHRQISCFSEIDSESVNSMIMQLLELEREDPDGEITIFINSPGGSVSDGLALYDVMQGISCPITTVCTGLAASMASLLFVAGNKRKMLTHSRVMIHDPLISKVGGNALSLKAISDDLMLTRQTTAEILAKHSGHTVEEILEKTNKDTFLTASESIDFGFADEIITKL